MSSRPVTWRRLGVSAVAAATVFAGLPLLLAGPAQAATTARLVLTPGAQTVAAGTCALFTITPVDSTGAQATDTPTVLIKATENPQSETQDVDFCEIPGVTTTPIGGSAFYYNGVFNAAEDDPFDPGVARTRRDYAPGTSITPDMNGNDPGGEPDTAANTDEQAPTGGANRNTNPNGQDFAQFAVPSGGQIKFGLVGLRLATPGANIEAYVERSAIDPAFPPTRSAAENDPTPAFGTLTFTNGGIAGSQTAADAVTQLDAEPETDAAVVGTTTFFTAELRNNTGQTVAGVTPNVQVTGANSAPLDQIRADCGRSDNNGVATCAFQGRNIGEDTLTVFVNRTSGTAGPDGGEAQDTITRTTTGPATTNTSEARSLVLTPDQANVVAGQAVTFTAAVTNGSGTPVNGVSVRFDESGPGGFGSSTAATSTVVMTSGAGRATVRFVTSAADRGANTISATIVTTGTQCAQGNCADSSPVTITAAATASPSATPTATISPRPSTSASPRPTTSSVPGCTTPASVSLDVTTITATGGANVTVRGTPNSVVELLAYSRPSTTYRVVRSGNVGADGAETYRITPPTNTRLFAQQRGCNASPSIVLNVRTQISLNVVRNGVRNYTFSGSLLPARPNGLIASLYRVTSDGRQILAAQTRANANVGQPGYDSSRPAGSYSIRRQFTGSGRFGFVVRTGQDLQNAPGSSNVRSLLVF